MAQIRNAERVLVGRPEGKILLGRPRSSWKDNIKMDLRQMVPVCNAWRLNRSSSGKVPMVGLSLFSGDNEHRVSLKAN